MSRPRICLSLYGTTGEIVNAIQTHDADLFEIRLDLCTDADGSAIRGATAKPLIFTAHGQPQLLERFWPFADYVDVEQGEAIGRNMIRSLHVAGSAISPVELWNRLSGEHRTKIVVETEDYGAIAELMELNRVHKPLALCFAAGEIGAFTRVVSVLNGAPWMYASLPDRATGAGQFTYEQLVETFRLRRFDAPNDIAVFGIIGNPVSHSRSPEFQNRKFEEAALTWVYLPFPCKELKSLLQYAPGWNSRGFSITRPYKEEVLPLLHSISPEAERSQSCNTIAFVDGHWIGTNTDLEGITAMLQGVPIQDARVVILGAGAAAKMFASIIRPEVASLTFLNRTKHKAEKLAALFDARSGSLPDLKAVDYDVLIQTTPVGWEKDEMPIHPDHLRSGKFVIESIYKDTTLLNKARALQCRTIDGKLWFDVQADAQFRWWRKVFTV